MNQSSQDASWGINALASKLEAQFERVVRPQSYVMPREALLERYVGLEATLPRYGEESVYEQVRLIAQGPISSMRISVPSSFGAALAANARTLGGRATAPEHRNNLLNLLFMCLDDLRMMFDKTVRRVSFTWVVR